MTKDTLSEHKLCSVGSVKAIDTICATYAILQGNAVAIWMSLGFKPRKQKIKLVK